MEILETSAEAWWRLASVIGQLMVRLEVSVPPLTQIGATLGELQRECEKLDLPLACAQLTRMQQNFERFDGGLAEFAAMFRPMVHDLNMRIWDELQNRFFLLVTADSIPLYRQTEPPFGEDVENKLLIGEDVEEAGKCLALGRSTACVFHLMRAMETAVKKLGEHLGVTVIDKNNIELAWGPILANINSAVEAMPRGKKQSRWSEACALLYHTKQAWRNETMHPKQTYTGKQAKEVFDATGSFMRSLAALL